MFRLYILLAYILPNVYVFFRMRKLFIQSQYKIHYAIIYLVAVLIFPFTEMLAHNENAGFFYQIFSIGYYILPFLLYLFLIILLCDILLLINIPIKIISKDNLNSVRFKNTGLYSVLIIPAIIVIYGICNFNHVRVSNYQVNIPKKSSKLDHLKIAFIADFHIGDRTRIGIMEQLSDKMKKINPDILMLGGDILEGDREDGKIKKFEEYFSKINLKYGVFAVLGNHEFYRGNSNKSFFKNSKIRLLRDTFLIIDKSFYLGGRYDSHFRNRKKIENLTTVINEDLPIILIDHRPTDTDAVSNTKVDIQLSGHTHHGQMFPLNLITNSIYELSWGYLKKKNTHFFVTCGIQLWGPPVRTIAKSEIMIIDVDFKE